MRDGEKMVAFVLAAHPARTGLRRPAGGPSLLPVQGNEQEGHRLVEAEAGAQHARVLPRAAQQRDDDPPVRPSRRSAMRRPRLPRLRFLRLSGLQPRVPGYYWPSSPAPRPNSPIQYFRAIIFLVHQEKGYTSRQFSQQCLLPRCSPLRLVLLPRTPDARSLLLFPLLATLLTFKVPTPSPASPLVRVDTDEKNIPLAAQTSLSLAIPIIRPIRIRPFKHVPSSPALQSLPVPRRVKKKKQTNKQKGKKPPTMGRDRAKSKATLALLSPCPIPRPSPLLSLLRHPFATRKAQPVGMMANQKSDIFHVGNLDSLCVPSSFPEACASSTEAEGQRRLLWPPSSLGEGGSGASQTTATRHAQAPRTGASAVVDPLTPPPKVLKPRGKVRVQSILFWSVAWRERTTEAAAEHDLAINGEALVEHRSWKDATMMSTPEIQVALIKSEIEDIKCQLASPSSCKRSQRQQLLRQRSE
jgi:hypothetical protein